MTRLLIDTALTAGVIVGVVMALRGMRNGDRVLRRNGHGVMAAFYAALAVYRWRTGQFVGCGVDVFFAAFFATAYWRDGGDDDWRRRRRKVAEWARSHIPRPVVVRIRPIPVGAS